MAQKVDLSKIKLGMTRAEVIAVLGKPFDTMVTDRKNPYPGILVYGNRGGGKKVHYEFHFDSNTRKDAQLWLVMKMPEHKTLMTTLSKATQERQRKLKEKWAKEDAANGDE